jgi:hypothetical protein
MKTRNRKKIILFWIACQVIALSLLFSSTLHIRAQQQQTITPGSTITGSTHGVVPMEGRASGSIGAICHAMCLLNECPTEVTYERSFNITVTFWNVGKLGGDQYKASITTLYPVGNDNDCFMAGGPMVSDFEGGPNGSVAGNGDYWQMKLVNGEYFAITFSGIYASIPVENPEIFDGWTDDVIDTPIPESTEDIIDTPMPEPTEEVIDIPISQSTDDCLNDPLNAAGCMSTPFVRQGFAAVISMLATLATLLVSGLGSAATATGETAAAGATGAASADAAALAAVGAATSVASITPSAIGGAAGIPASQTPSPGQGKPASGKMTQAEFRQLTGQRNALAERAQQLNREEQKWRIESRRIYDLLQRGITNYQSNASKVLIGLGKEVLDWVPIVVTGPGNLVNTAVEKIADQVNTIITTPPPKGATDAQILEHMRETNRLLEEKLAEAKKMRNDLHGEKQAVINEINEIDNCIKDNPVILPY